MQLAIHSNASYLSVSQVRIRASWVHFLSEGPPNPKNPEDSVPTVNGIILVVYKIMRNIMASKYEARYITIFVNTQTYVPIHTTLNKWGGNRGVSPKEIKGHVYAILLDKQQNQTETLLILLETGPRTLKGLSFQRSST